MSKARQAKVPADELKANVERGHGLSGLYRLEQLIAEGGMGAVYNAVQLQLERTVAVKVLRPPAEHPMADSTESARRFVAEARLAARIADPNVVKVIDVGSGPAGLFIVYELVEGVSLRELLSGPTRLLPEEGLRLLAQAAQGLAAIHAAGVVHRDLKPENMLIDRAGTLKLTDLGIARDLTSSAIRTREGFVFGTPRYMSPEQCAGRPVGPSSDIYSLGVIAYELLTGAPPFESDDVAVLVQSHTHDEPPPPSSRSPSLSDCCDGLVLRLLAKREEARPQDAGELAKLLEQLAQTVKQEAQPRHAKAAGQAATVVSRSASAASADRTQLAVPPGSRPVRPTMAVPVISALLLVGAAAVLLRPGPTPAISAKPADPSRPPVETEAARPNLVAQPANRHGFIEYICQKDHSVLILVPAGPFVAGGADEEAFTDERPQRRIALSAYLIGKTEVTWGQYKRFCREAGKRTPPVPDGSGDAHPVVNIAWFDAVAYCQWAGLRLPSELEWEKASRGPDGRLYPWGNQPPTLELANCKPDIYMFALKMGAHKVGKDLAGQSVYGALEMSGNVWELCSDWYDPARLSRLRDGETDPAPPARGETRVSRGGGYTNGIKEMRCSNRSTVRPDRREDNLGFRVASRVP